MIAYVVENEGAGETDRSWWIDTIVSHKDTRFLFMNNFEEKATIKKINQLCLQILCKKKTQLQAMLLAYANHSMNLMCKSIKWFF